MSIAAVRSILQIEGNSTSNPIVIPSTVLESAKYQVTLLLTNWFGASRVLSLDFTVSSTTDTPSVNILGERSRTIRVHQRLELSAEGSVSGCASSNTLTYSWEIYRNFLLRSLTSESKDPRKLVISAYNLKSGVTYQCKVSVKSESGSSSFAVVDVYVEPGPIRMEVSGGYVRMHAIDKPLLLDASGSADLNVDPMKRSLLNDLALSWSCSVTSVERFGSPCNEIFGVNANFSLPFIKVVNMTMGFKYAVTLVGASTDGRSSSATVSVSPLSSGSAIVRIQTKTVKFNSDSTLKLTGGLIAFSNQTISWDVFPIVSLENYGLTQPSKNVSMSEVKEGLVFSLAVQPSVFAPGKTFTFRLTSSPISASPDSQNQQSHFSLTDSDSSMTSYSEISLQVNAPPTSGILVVSPLNGTEMVTSFTVLSRNWIDDPADYPLAYAFAYVLDKAGETDFTLSLFSEKSYTVTPLPAGLLSMNSTVLCKGVIRDNMGAGVTVSQAVYVMSSAAPGQDVASALSTVLDTQLEKAFASGNNDAVMKSINVVASSISTVNCSAAPACRALNRNLCSTVTQTCGTCLQGFLGIAGHSNSKCSNASGILGLLDSPCRADSECIYNLCTSGKCRAPSKQCPSNTADASCSGHGFCSFYSVTGSPIKNCTEIDVGCSANCACADGYGGTDCSLDANALKTRGAMRGNMCNALMKTLERSTVSADLLESMISSLLQVYTPYEVVDNPTRYNCSELLTHMAQLASLGHLAKSVKVSLSVTIAQTISLFAINNVDGSISSTSEPHQQNAIASVGSLEAAVLKSVVTGQKPSNILSNGVRLTVTKQLPQDMVNTSLSPPQTEAEKQYGAPGPSFRLPISPFTCPGARKSAATQMGMMQWGRNPYGNSATPENSTVDSPLSRFSNTVKPPKKKANKKKRGSRKPVMSPVASPTMELPDPYHIVIQFAKEITLEELQSSTFISPACGVLREGIFIKCPCNETGISTKAVTYTCYDRSFLCPKLAGKRTVMTDSLTHSLTY